MMQEHTTEPPRRPLAITLIAIIIGIGGGVSFSFTLLLLSTGNTQSHVFVGGWLALLMAACVRGFWLMRRWAYFLFIGVALITQAGAYTAGNLHILSVLLPALIIAVSTLYLGRMTKLRLFERLFGSADNAGRSVRIARWGFVISVLLVLYTLAKLGSSNNVEFEVIDSELKALQGGSAMTYWLDNETVIFRGGWRKGEDRLPLEERKRHWGLVAWNYKTDQISKLVDVGYATCFENGILYYAQEKGELYKAEIASTKGNLKITNAQRLPSTKYVPAPRPHCEVTDRENQNREVIARLRAFDGEIRKTKPENIPQDMQGVGTGYNTTYFSPNFPEGWLLRELRGLRPSVRYIEHRNIYVLRIGKKTDQKFISAHLTPYEHWQLSSNGEMSVLPVPDGWNRASSIFPTVKGVVIRYLDMRKRKPGANDRGVYLITGPRRRDATELLHGYLAAESLSPDGCKIAGAYTPDSRLGRMPKLKIIDLCVKEN